MADFSGIYTPGPAGSIQTGTVATGTSSGEIVLSNRARIDVAVNGAAFVAFGNASMAAASASSVPMWANSHNFFQLGDQYDRIRIFNNSGGTITYWVVPFTT